MKKKNRDHLSRVKVKKKKKKNRIKTRVDEVFNQEHKKAKGRDNYGVSEKNDTQYRKERVPLGCQKGVRHNWGGQKKKKTVHPCICESVPKPEESGGWSKSGVGRVNQVSNENLRMYAAKGAAKEKTGILFRMGRGRGPAGSRRSPREKGQKSRGTCQRSSNGEKRPSRGKTRFQMDGWKNFPTCLSPWTKDAHNSGVQGLTRKGSWKGRGKSFVTYAGGSRRLRFLSGQFLEIKKQERVLEGLR